MGGSPDFFHYPDIWYYNSFSPVTPGSHRPLKGSLRKSAPGVFRSHVTLPCGWCRCGVKSSVPAESSRQLSLCALCREVNCHSWDFLGFSSGSWAPAGVQTEQFLLSELQWLSSGCRSTATHPWLCWQNCVSVVLTGLLHPPHRASSSQHWTFCVPPQTGHGMCAGSLWKLWDAGRLWHNIIIICSWPQCVQSTGNEQHFPLFLSLCTL